jgi:uncharacterized protein YjbI with pentapeptide repeats
MIPFNSQLTQEKQKSWVKGRGDGINEIKEANFNKGNFKQANLKRSNLLGTDLIKANIADANFTVDDLE